MASIWAQQNQQTDANAPVLPPSVWAALDPQAAATQAALSSVKPQASGPQVFASSQAPTVTLAPQKPNPLQQQIASDQTRLTQLEKPATPWKQLSPGQKIGRVFADIGNVAGNIFAPSTMALIPGTELHKQVEEGGLARRLNAETQTEAENEARGAQTAEAQERTREAPGEAESRENLENAQAAEAENKIQQGPDLVTAYAHAVNDAIKNGRDPAQDPIVQHLSDAITGIQKQPAPKGVIQSQPVMGPDGKPHTYLLDPTTGQKIGDLGVHYERPITVNAGDAELDRDASRLGKPYQTAVTNGQAQLDKIDEASSLIGGNAEAQALGVPKTLTALVSGQGTGVRITQPELNAIAKARGVQGDFEGALRRMEGGGHLTPTQQKQVQGILADAKARLQKKIDLNNQALDAINGAPNREGVIQADKDARQRMTDLERYGHYKGETITLKDGSQKTVTAVHPDGSFDAQ